MNRFSKWMLAAALAAGTFGCGDGGGNNDVDGSVPPVDGNVGDPCANAPATANVTSDITANTTWCAETTYTLKNRIYVTNDAVLTIEPGTTILGDSMSALVVTRGARLAAVGTAAEPIVFTSSQPAGSRAPGDWGGVVLFGGATTNLGSNVLFEGLTDEAKNYYGGNDSAHDCGHLSHVEIHFAGEVFAPNKEFNSLTVAGCGSQTQLHHIHTNLGADDGVEFFGGTANIDHVVINGPEDDGLDYDNGWSGTAQYVVIHFDAALNDKGIEADNNESGTTAAPRTAPKIYNITLIGQGALNKASRCMHIRRSTLGFIRNAICTGWGDFDNADVAMRTNGIRLEPPTLENEDANTYNARWGVDFAVEHSYFHQMIIPASDTTSLAAGSGQTAGTFMTSDRLMEAARHNVFGTDPMITVGNGALPSYCPAAGAVPVSGSPAAAGIDAAGLGYASACAPGTQPANAWYAWMTFPKD